jgi:hypothetical protein
MDKRKLKKIIEILVERAFLYEKDEAGIDLSGPEPAEKVETSTSDASKNTGGSTEDTATDTGLDSTVNNTTSPEDPTGDSTPVSEPDALGGITDEPSDSSGGGFKGMGGGFSGSSSFGSDGTTNDSEPVKDNSTEATPEESFEESIPEDPVKDTIDIALKLTKEIGDNQIILNVVKSKMQKYFADFSDAVPIIQGLWDTNDPNLKIVARKLIMFIQGD